MTSADLKAQLETCRRYEAEFCPAAANNKIGIAMNARTGLLPLNGLRHPSEGDTTGWYIWAGEKMSESPDYFAPLHVEHLHEWCPQVIKFLGLPPGWRFLVAKDHEDVWFDESLLKV